MNKILAALFIIVTFSSFAQERVEQGVIYQSGQKVYGPVAGLSSVIPAKWMGLMPQGTEAFLLIPGDNSNAQIITVVTKDSIEEIKKRWKSKMEFSEGIFLEMENEPVERNGWLVGDIKVTGSTNHPGGYIEAKCGEWGVCAINLLVASDKDINKYKKDLIAFSDASEFTEPKLTSRYADFDWLPYLQNTMLVKWTHDPGYRRNNQVHLCQDGKFRSKLKTKGIVEHEDSPYMGSNSGEWEVQGIGPTAKLYLYFNKLSPLIVDLKMNDGKLFINGIQYFSMESDKCAD